MKLCLVCSSGGHFFQLFSLRKAWENSGHFWVSFPTEDAKSSLKGEQVYWAHYPTNRNIKNLIRNSILAWKILKKEKPDMIISTGAGVGVPFIWIGRLMGVASVYIESITRIERVSLSGFLVYHCVDKFLVQWPELAAKYKKAEYHGRVI